MFAKSAILMLAVGAMAEGTPMIPVSKEAGACPIFDNWQLIRNSWPEFPQLEPLTLTIQGTPLAYYVKAHTFHDFAATWQAADGYCSVNIGSREVHQMTPWVESAMTQRIASELTRKMLENVLGVVASADGTLNIMMNDSQMKRVISFSAIPE